MRNEYGQEDRRDEHFVDADVFMGMHHEDDAVRRSCKAFFVRHLNDGVTMSLEQVGRCDDLVWCRPRALQDAYYPFMDRLHTDMAIDRVGYTEQDTDRAWRDPALRGFPSQRRLTLGQVLSRGGTLWTIGPEAARGDLPVRTVPAQDAEAVFPDPLERLYQDSLVLRVPAGNP